MNRLPIDGWIPTIVESVRKARAAVVVAAPGAGKTTRVPPALAADGPAIVLQPRRVAARSIARRIAGEQGWTIGREVGWHVRFERRFGPDTRVLLATEGILTGRLQHDPLLSAFRTVVLDEFHERSIHADLGIALAKQAWRARSDLRIVIMSATLDAAKASAFLDDAPVVEIPGQPFPLAVRYRPGASLAAAVQEALSGATGQVLCFLPGAPEIRASALELQSVAGSAAEVIQLHGSLLPAEQDRAIEAVAHRRVILATNIAETSLTVPGVHAVVDTGLHKVARYDADRAIDSLDTERISRDSADQRAGRAARLGPGVAIRLWAEADRLRAHREADIHRMDLSGPLLDVIAWGGDPLRFEWFDPPSPAALDAGLDLLQLLGAIENGAITPLGLRMQALPLHPRLARVLLALGGARPSALACAILSERHYLPPRAETTTSDLLAAVEDPGLPSHVTRVAEDLMRSTGSAARKDRTVADDTEFRRALFLGYPDRVGKRRSPGSPRVLLRSGYGAVVGTESGVRDGEYILALDVQSGRRGEEARIRLASIVEQSWLSPTATAIEHEYDASAGVVRAWSREYYGAIVLSQTSVAPDPERAADLLAAAWVERGPAVRDEQLVRRLRFAGIDADLRALAASAARGRRSIHEMDLAGTLSWEMTQQVDRLAPDRIVVPSGRSHPLEYEEDGSVASSVKLQELFGLAETPTVGPRGVPVLLRLLAPNGRPVQTTRDLRSFWERTYPEVRKELRGRYPKHPWPENPWSATPTARTSKRIG